jgi:hypothetical protein
MNLGRQLHATVVVVGHEDRFWYVQVMTSSEIGGGTSSSMFGQGHVT